jgi:hypothetical protein
MGGDVGRQLGSRGGWGGKVSLEGKGIGLVMLYWFIKFTWLAEWIVVYLPMPSHIQMVSAFSAPVALRYRFLPLWFQLALRGFRQI